MNHTLTSERLQGVLKYFPDTGVFIRLMSGGGRKAGSVAGTGDVSGYRKIRVDGKNYWAHRLAWLYFHGAWPEDEIDFINGDFADNRIANLRSASRAINMQNLRGPKCTNKTGYLGVDFYRYGYRAQIKVDGKAFWLGRFSTPELAYDAYIEAKHRLHPGCTI